MLIICLMLQFNESDLKHVVRSITTDNNGLGDDFDISVREGIILSQEFRRNMTFERRGRVFTAYVVLVPKYTVPRF